MRSNLLKGGSPVRQSSFCFGDIVEVARKGRPSCWGKVCTVTQDLVKVRTFKSEHEISGTAWHYPGRDVFFNGDKWIYPSRLKLLYRAISHACLWPGREIRFFDTVKTLAEVPLYIRSSWAVRDGRQHWMEYSRSMEGAASHTIPVMKLEVPRVYVVPGDETFYVGDEVEVGRGLYGRITGFSFTGKADVSGPFSEHSGRYRLGDLRRVNRNDFGSLMSHGAELIEPVKLFQPYGIAN